MYVFLFIKSNFSSVLNDIDVVCKSILLSSLKILLLISPKWTLFDGVKDSIGNGSRICVFSIGGHGKLNWQMAWLFFLQVFLWWCVCLEDNMFCTIVSVNVFLFLFKFTFIIMPTWFIIIYVTRNISIGLHW